MIVLNNYLLVHVKKVTYKPKTTQSNVCIKDKINSKNNDFFPVYIKFNLKGIIVLFKMTF